jgi:lysophospholipase L1-like esterase
VKRGDQVRDRGPGDGVRAFALARRARLLGAAVLTLWALAFPPSASASHALYVALGESIAAGVGASSPATSYVGRLYSQYQGTLGVDELSNRAQGGASSSSLRYEGQLASALGDIGAASDTRAVTISIGGNDGQALGCSQQWDSPSCPFRANLAAILGELRAGLDADPGDEVFAVMAYFNPASGTGGGLEASFDQGLLGNNLSVGCEDHGPAAGLNDVIYQEAGTYGALVADPYAGFKQGGQALMADLAHPNDAGHAVIAEAFGQASDGCLPKAARTLTLDANKNKVKKGKKVTLSGQLNATGRQGVCESGQTVALQRKRPKQTTFVTFTQDQTDAQGNFSLKKKVKKTFEYRAQVAETDACLGQTSNTEKVKVKKK